MWISISTSRYGMGYVNICIILAAKLNSFFARVFHVAVVDWFRWRFFRRKDPQTIKGEWVLSYTAIHFTISILLCMMTIRFVDFSPVGFCHYHHHKPHFKNNVCSICALDTILSILVLYIVRRLLVFTRAENTELFSRITLHRERRLHLFTHTVPILYYFIRYYSLSFFSGLWQRPNIEPHTGNIIMCVCVRAHDYRVVQ